MGYVFQLSYFADEETKYQRREVTCPQSVQDKKQINMRLGYWEREKKVQIAPQIKV